MADKTRKEQLQEMLAEDPSDPFLHYGLAMEFQSVGQLQEAARCFDELLRLHPAYVPAYYQAGKTLGELDRTDEARALLCRGMEVAQRQGDSHAAGEMEMLLDSLV